MNTTQVALTLGSLLLSAAARDLNAQGWQAPSTSTAQPAASAPQNFTRSFYDWYSTLVKAKHSAPPWLAALDQRAAHFKPELSQALRGASMPRKGDEADDIEELDFDPFLWSQDPCERYEVGKVTGKGASYHVEVYSICEGEKSDRPEVIVELVQTPQSWVFVNFHYPEDDSDLLSELRMLRDDD